MRSPRLWFLIAICLLMPWQIAMVVGDPWFRLPPKPVGDGPDYENIAYHLSQGEGWSLDWTNPGWRAPYENADQPNDYAVQLSRSDGLTPTTGRPPLFPAIVAAIYWIAGRGDTAFACVRLLLAACLAVAGAVATAFSAKIVGAVTNKSWPVGLAATGTLALAVLDRTVRTYATDFLTEPLALVLMQLWLWCVCELLGVFGGDTHSESGASRGSRHIALATLLGILLGLLIYTRSIMVLWLPGVWLLIWLAGWFRTVALERHSNREPIDHHLARNPSRALATRVVLVCVVVCAPWWIRNCVVLESWMPLGTQGPITLLGGYSDEALLHYGEWQPEPEQRLRAWAEYEFAPEDDASRREVRIAREASHLVGQWTREHITQLPRLALMRAVNEWNPYSGRALVWKILALAGLAWLAVVAPRAAWVLGGVLVLNTLCVMMLYSVGGRFLVPLYGVLYTLAGLGMTGLALVLEQFGWHWLGQCFSSSNLSSRR